MSTSMVKAAYRRGTQTLAQTDAGPNPYHGRLRLTPDGVRQATASLIQVIANIGLPKTDPSGPTFVIPVDKNAPTLTRMSIQVLKSVPVIGTATGITPEGQRTLLDKYRAMMSLYGKSVEVAAALDDSQAAMAVVLRDYWVKIKKAVKGARALGIFTNDELELMETAVAQLEAEEARLAQVPVDRRAQSRRSDLRHQANLAAMNDHDGLLQTIVDLHNGVAVDDQRVNAAYDELHKEPEAAPQTGTRSTKTPGSTVH